MDQPSPPSGLRAQLFSGGRTLLGLQVVTVAIKLAGLVFVTNALGAGRYGPFAAAFGLFSFLLGVGQSGIGVYLTRHDGALDRRQTGTATLLLLGLAVILLAPVEAGAGLIAGWTRVAGVAPVLRIVMIALPLQTLSIPALAALRRNLDLTGIAVLDLVGQGACYLLAVPLVWAGAGAEALAWGVVAQYAVMIVLAQLFARQGLVFAWDAAVAARIGRYTLSFSVANYAWQMRSLAAPFIIAPLLGGTAVGIVGMATGIVEILTSVRTNLWLLAVAALAKVQGDTERLRRAVSEGMELHLLVLGAVVLGFGWFGGWLVPLTLGPSWLPMFAIYPYVAIFYLTVSTFNMHTAVLSVLDRNGLLAVYQAVHVLSFFAVTALCAPALGLYGYGVGELASLSTYLLLHAFVARRIGSPDYRLMGVWSLAVAIGLFWRTLGPWAIAAPFLALLWPGSPRRLGRIWAAATGTVTRP